MPAKAAAPAPLAKGISAVSRSQSYAKRALFKVTKAKATVPKPTPTTRTKTVGGAKNGKTRTIAVASAAAYDPSVKQAKVCRKTARPSTTRSSITPGTVLILLGGRFRGKRVVYLRTLESGLLLVTGPHKINGVPLKRVNQAFVIATSTRLDISKVKVDAKLNDAYFARAKRTGAAKPTAEELFEAAKAPRVLDAGRVKDQKAMDALLLPLIKKTPLLSQYLNASFALTKGQYPHAIKF